MLSRTFMNANGGAGFTGNRKNPRIPVAIMEWSRCCTHKNKNIKLVT